jgi:hypothetical protein
MSYIDPQILIDEVASDVNETDDLTTYLDATDRAIAIACAKNFVRLDEIPLDVNEEFTTSPYLIEYGILEFKHRVFLGYTGSSDGDGEDIYSVKLKLIDKDYRDIKAGLTHESILGIFTDSGEPKGRLVTMSQIPMINGA